MKIKAIKNNVDYEATLRRIEKIMDAEFGTSEGDELDILSTLVDAYENDHFPIDEPDPIEFLKQTMMFKGETQASLSKILCSRSRANEILTKRRPLTLTQIRRIVEAWNIPATPLIHEYNLSKTTSKNLSSK